MDDGADLIDLLGEVRSEVAEQIATLPLSSPSRAPLIAIQDRLSGQIARALQSGFTASAAGVTEAKTKLSAVCADLDALAASIDRAKTVLSYAAQAVEIAAQVVAAI